MAKKKSVKEFEEKFTTEEDREPEDIYNEESRQDMVEDDEITASEEGFMRGWDGPIEGGKKRRKHSAGHDTPSVDLVKEQYKED